MVPRFLFLLMLFQGLPCRAQAPNVTKTALDPINWSWNPESIVNALHLGNNKSDSFYFSHHSSHLYIARDEEEGLILEFGKFAPVDIIREIIEMAHRDTTEKYWNCELIRNANCIDGRDAVAAIDSHGEGKNPLGIREIFSCSRPVVDRSGIYAVIKTSSYCGNLCGTGCTILLKLENGVWKSKKAVLCWIS